MPLKFKVMSGCVTNIPLDVTTIGLGQQPTSLTVQPSDHTAFLVGLPLLGRPRRSPVTIATSICCPICGPGAEHVTDQLQIRFDASRTLIPATA